MGCGIGHLVLCCYSNCVFVPYIVGKYSLLTGKIFPYFLGINSHNIWDNRNLFIFNQEKEEDNILTMRNTLKYYENKVNFKLK